MFFFFLFLTDTLLSSQRVRILKRNAKHCVLSQPNLGPDIDSTVWTSFGHYLLFIVCWNRNSASSKTCILKPAPRNIGTLFVNTTALTEIHLVCFYSACFCVFAVSFLVLTCFLLGMQNPQIRKITINNRKEPDNNIQTSKQSSRVNSNRERQHTHTWNIPTSLNRKPTTQQEQERNRIDKNFEPALNPKH